MQNPPINTRRSFPIWLPGVATKSRQHLLVGLLLLIYVVIQSYAITRLSISYDEESFLQYGITLLKGQGKKDISKFESKLPITALNALPRAVEQLNDPTLKKNSPLEDVMAGRFISLMVSVALGILIFSWSAKWYGYGAGCCSLIFYLLCPNFLAHGIFLSSDIYAFLFIALTVFLFSQYYETGKRLYFLGFSICFAFGLISKFSLLHMIPVMIITAVVLWFYQTPKQAVFTRDHLILAGIFILVNWLVISGSHLFYDLFFPLDKYEYRSAAFRDITGMLGSLSSFVYIPLPSSYIRSIDMVMYFDSLGGGVPGSLNGKPYILGQYSTHGFWYYYFVCFFYKVPIAFLLIFLASVKLYARNFNVSQFMKKEIFLLVPFLYYLVYMSFFYSTQVGIRHILIIFPFMFVFTGYLFQKVLAGRTSIIIPALVAWELISVASFFPHFLPYTNEFITNKKNAYKKLADTNLCYREGRRYIDEYLATHKNAVFEPSTPIAGLVIVEVNDYLGIQDDSVEGKYQWLRGLEPVDHIHSQYLIFDVPVK